MHFRLYVVLCNTTCRFTPPSPHIPVLSSCPSPHSLQFPLNSCRTVCSRRRARFCRHASSMEKFCDPGSMRSFPGHINLAIQLLLSLVIVHPVSNLLFCVEKTSRTATGGREYPTRRESRAWPSSGDIHQRRTI